MNVTFHQLRVFTEVAQQAKRFLGNLRDADNAMARFKRLEPATGRNWWH